MRELLLIKNKYILMSRLINFHALHVVVFPDHRFLQLIVLFLLFETQKTT